MNNNPVIRNGTITTREPGFPEKDLKRIVPAMKETINNNPPKSSFFQATTRIAQSTSTGIL